MRLVTNHRVGPGWRRHRVSASLRWTQNDCIVNDAFHFRAWTGMPSPSWVSVRAFGACAGYQHDRVFGLVHWNTLIVLSCG